MPEQTAQENLLTYFYDFFYQDWFASFPITASLIVMLAVIIERSIYYSRNKRELSVFIRTVQKELEKNNIEGAISFSQHTGGLIGLMTEEGLRLIRFHSRNFINAFDISAALYLRDLEKGLSALATIGATAPFLGLFGTVIGVIVTLKEMGEGNHALVVTGVAKALVATGYGLIVAIIAVVLNNYFNSVVKRFENDFQVIKLTLIDFIQTSNSFESNNFEFENNNIINKKQVINKVPSAPMPYKNL